MNLMFPKPKKAAIRHCSLKEWRTSNINALVSLVYQKIKEANPNVLFGIAPQGNLSNDEAMGALMSLPGALQKVILIISVPKCM